MDELNPLDYDDPNDFADAVAARARAAHAAKPSLWTRFYNWLYSWGYIFVWAQICIWEKLTRQEVSCPDCWKCTFSRWLLFTLMVGGFLWLTGWWMHLLYGLIVLFMVIVFQGTYLLGWLISLLT